LTHIEEPKRTEMVCRSLDLPLLIWADHYGQRRKFRGVIPERTYGEKKSANFHKWVPSLETSHNASSESFDCRENLPLTDTILNNSN